MRDSIRLGHIFGISIGIHSSWFIVFILVIWSLATGFLPQGYPGWSATAYWAAAAITSLLFFASVLFHELAHSLVAQANGIPVASITLFIFGGVAQIRREAHRPGVEFWMALAGPLSSLVLGALFGIAWLFTRGISGPTMAIASYLAQVNLLLALFNLIPGFPLDGGRVFRSLVWQWSGNLRLATRMATGTGQIVAFAFIAWGILLVFSGSLLNGLWLAFIGWFMNNAADASFRQVAIRELLEGVTAGDLMSRDCPTVPAGLSIEELVREHILRTGARCFLVEGQVGEGTLGIVTLHGVKNIPRSRWEEATLSEIVLPLDAVKKVRSSDPITQVLQWMDEDGVNQLPVMDDGKLLGMIRRDNLLGYIRTRAELRM